MSRFPVPKVAAGPSGRLASTLRDATEGPEAPGALCNRAARGPADPPGGGDGGGAGHAGLDGAPLGVSLPVAQCPRPAGQWESVE